MVFLVSPFLSLSSSATAPRVLAGYTLWLSLFEADVKRKIWKARMENKASLSIFHKKGSLVTSHRWRCNNLCPAPCIQPSRGFQICLWGLLKFQLKNGGSSPPIYQAFKAYDTSRKTILTLIEERNRSSFFLPAGQIQDSWHSAGDWSSMAGFLSR